MTRSVAVVAVVTVVALAISGCSAEASAPEEEATTASGDQLRDGVFTQERPEVGFMVTNGMSFCTATLVSPTAVLTAAHCVGYGTEDANGQKLGWFSIERSGKTHDFDYDAYVSYGKSWGRDDVALLRLKASVPSELARPAKLATSAPTDESNAPVTLFGYGCSHRPGLFGGDGNDDHVQHKQMRQFEMGPVRYVCPGDSGGPTVWGLDGDVFRVSSRMFTVEVFGLGVPDAFGDVVYNRSALLEQIALWSKSGPR